MKMLRVTALVVAAGFAGMLAACDSTSSGIVAGLGGSTNDSSGRQQLVVSPSAIALTTGSTFQLSASAPTTLQNLLQWSSVNPTVATVSPAGVVLASSAGSTAVSVRYSDDTTNVGTATVTVVGTPSSTNDVRPK
jgi:hypothetical protein